jgi:HEAT repeat protein
MLAEPRRHLTIAPTTVCAATTARATGHGRAASGSLGRARTARRAGSQPSALALVAAAGLAAASFAGARLGPMAATAEAQGRGRGARPAGPTVADAAAMLEARDEGTVRLGIETLGLTGSAEAVRPLAARVRRGLPPELLDLAVDTLVVLARPEAAEILTELAQHRRASVRLKAVTGLAQIRPRGVEGVLSRALDDGDPQVRAAAAVGLGQVGARASVDALFLALDRGVLEAATAIAQLATPPEIDRLLAYVGRLDLATLAPALVEIVARRDVPERKKLDVVARVAELATGEAKRFLGDLAASVPEGSGAAVRRAAEDAALRIAD